MADPGRERILPGRLGLLAGKLVHSYLRRVAPEVELIGGADLQARVRVARQAAPGRRIAVYYWIEDALPLMLYGCVSEMLLDEPLRFVCDDSLGGEATAAVLERLGQDHSPLRLADGAARVRDVQQLIKDPAAIGIAVDGRGPYRAVGLEFARLIRRCDALAIPLAVRLDRSHSIRMGATIRIPKRRTRLLVAPGEAVSVTEGTAADLRVRMQSGLEAAVAAADARLARRATEEPTSTHDR